MSHRKSDLGILSTPVMPKKSAKVVLGCSDDLMRLGIPKGVYFRFKAGFWRSALEDELLRDDQWERIKPFVPGGRKGKRGPRSNQPGILKCAIVDGPLRRTLTRSAGTLWTLWTAKRRYYRWIEMRRVRSPVPRR